jgi:hypothetical protein
MVGEVWIVNLTLDPVIQHPRRLAAIGISLAPLPPFVDGGSPPMHPFVIGGPAQSRILQGVRPRTAF